MGHSGFLWTLIGQALNVLSFFGANVEEARQAVMNSPFMSFLINNWWWITFIIVSLAISEGIYRKAYPYVGDKVIANKIAFIPQEENPISRGELYAWISVENNEGEDVIRKITLSLLLMCFIACSLSAVRLKA